MPPMLAEQEEKPARQLRRKSKGQLSAPKTISRTPSGSSRSASNEHLSHRSLMRVPTKARTSHDHRPPSRTWSNDSHRYRGDGKRSEDNIPKDSRPQSWYYGGTSRSHGFVHH